MFTLVTVCKVVHAGDRQVNHDHDEYVPACKEYALSGTCWCMCSAPNDLAHGLLLCRFPLHRALHVAWSPKGNWLDH